MFLRKDTRDIRTVWGYTFEWTPEHQTKEQLRPLTYTYDVLATECLDRLDQLSPPPSASAPLHDGEKTPINPRVQGGNDDDDDDDDDNNKKKSNKKPSPGPVGKDTQPTTTTTPSARRDLYTLLATHHPHDATLAALWSQLHTVPPWVDWAQIARGQAVFYRYGGPALVSLTFQSLVGGMAGWRVVETLARTGGFNAAVAKHRLLETFQHLLQVTRDLASIQPGGDGFAASVRVRLLHASVRRRVLALARRRAGYFDVAAWGVPISDLDSLGTVLSFSAALIWIGLPRQGIYLTAHEVDDYLALWRWVALLLGTPADDTSCLASPRAAKAFFESLIVAELVPSDMGGVLANNILTGLSDQPPAFASRAFLCAEARWLNGGELCDALGIADPGLWYRALVAVQCAYFMGVCYVKRAVPAWDSANRERVSKIFYKITVENKEIGLGQETIFDFKYVPQIGLTTPLGAGAGAGTGAKRVGGGAAQGQGLATSVVVALVAALMGSAAWFGLRTALGLAGLVS